MRRVRVLLIFVGLCLLLAGCAGSAAPASQSTTVSGASTASPTASSVPGGPAVDGGVPTTASTTGVKAAGEASKEVTVFAAASLTEPFNEMGPAFSAGAGGAKVSFNFGGSNTLRAQIEQGAGADVFASANEQEMDTLVKSGIVTSSPAIFAKNRLVVILPRANPGKIQKLQDLGNGGLKIVAAGPNVPVGRYMLQMVGKMNADPAYGDGFKDRFMKNVISQETDVKQVVAKVQLGEGDAGVVYSTDVSPKVMPDVQVLDVPDAFNVFALYPIAPIDGARREDLGRAFLDYVLSADGQGIMKKYNFLSPE